VRDFEAGRRIPIANNLTAIRRALEAGGIELLFNPDGGALGIAAQLGREVVKDRPAAEGKFAQYEPEASDRTAAVSQFPGLI